MIRCSAAASATRTADDSARCEHLLRRPGREWSAATAPISATQPHHANAERREQPLRRCADGDTGGRFARARPLQDVPHVVVVVLEDAGEVGMTGSRPRDRDARVTIGGFGRHLLLPVLPVPVLDHQRDRRAQGFAPADSRFDARLVLLDRHPPAAAVSLLPAPQVMIDRADIDREPCGEALDDRRQARPVGLSGGKEAKHGELHCLTKSSKQDKPADGLHAFHAFRLCHVTSVRRDHSGRASGRAVLGSTGSSTHRAERGRQCPTARREPFRDSRGCACWCSNRVRLEHQQAR